MFLGVPVGSDPWDFRAATEFLDRGKGKHLEAVSQVNPSDWIELDADPPVRSLIESGICGDRTNTAIL